MRMLTSVMFDTVHNPMSNNFYDAQFPLQFLRRMKDNYRDGQLLGKWKRPRQKQAQGNLILTPIYLYFPRMEWIEYQNWSQFIMYVLAVIRKWHIFPNPIRQYDYRELEVQSNNFILQIEENIIHIYLIRQIFPNSKIILMNLLLPLTNWRNKFSPLLSFWSMLKYIDPSTL